MRATPSPSCKGSRQGRSLHKKFQKNTEIVIAKLGNDAGIIGAAFLGRANA